MVKKNKRTQNFKNPSSFHKQIFSVLIHTMSLSALFSHSLVLYSFYYLFRYSFDFLPLLAPCPRLSPPASVAPTGVLGRPHPVHHLSTVPLFDLIKYHVFYHNLFPCYYLEFTRPPYTIQLLTPFSIVTLTSLLYLFL